MIVQMFGTGVQSKSPVVTSQRRENLYYEIRPDGDKTKVAIYGTPGLTRWQSFNEISRGMVNIAGRGYTVIGNKLYLIDDDESEVDAYVNLPGTVGDKIDTPDSADLSITGDISILVRVAPQSWSPAALNELVAKYETPNLSYRFYIPLAGGTGDLGFGWSSNGIAVTTKTASTPTGFANGTSHWVMVTFDVDNGAAGSDCKFWAAPDSIDIPAATDFGQVGSTQTTAGTTSIFDGTATCVIGGEGTGGNPLTGQVYHVLIYSGIYGSGSETLVAEFNARDGTGNESAVISSTTGETWTIGGNAELVYFRATEVGTLTTSSGLVDMAFDENVLLIVDGTAGYTYDFATATLTQITDVDFPNGAAVCTWLVGYFVVAYGNLFYISEDGTSWDSLDSASASAAPDGIRKLLAQASQLVIFGYLTTEFWDIIPGTFPLAQVGASTIEMGIFSPSSIAKTHMGSFYLARLKSGEARVCLLQGFNSVQVSTADVETVINRYSTLTDAVGFSYEDGGHLFYQISFPTDNKTWLYDATSQLWAERTTGASGDRHRGNLAIRLFNQIYLSDFENGNLYLLDDTVYEDNGETIIREIVGKHVFDDFNRVIIDEFQIGMETGVGLQSGQGSDPQIMLQISKDGGRTWGNELWTSIGEVGEYLTNIHWRRLGIARDWVFKLRMSDPVKFVLTTASIQARKAAA